MVSPAGNSIVPADCHDQSCPLAPSSVARVVSPTESVNRPGWCDGTQSFARTHTS